MINITGTPEFNGTDLQYQERLMLAKFRAFEIKLASMDLKVKGDKFEEFAMEILYEFYNASQRKKQIRGYEIWSVKDAFTGNAELLEFLGRMGVLENGKPLARDKGFDIYVRMIAPLPDSTTEFCEKLDLIQVKYRHPDSRLSRGDVESSNNEYKKIQSIYPCPENLRLIYFTNLPGEHVSIDINMVDGEKLTNTCVFDGKHIALCYTGRILDEFLGLENIECQNHHQILDLSIPPKVPFKIDFKKLDMFSKIKPHEIPMGFSKFTVAEMRQFCKGNNIKVRSNASVSSIIETVSEYIKGPKYQLPYLKPNDLKKILTMMKIPYKKDDDKPTLVKKIGDI